MSQFDVPKLDTGETFPVLDLAIAAGSSLRLPDDMRGQWIIFLIYRGLF